MDKRRIASTRAATRISTVPVVFSASTVQFIDAASTEIPSLILVCQSINSPAIGPVGATPAAVDADQVHTSSTEQFAVDEGCVGGRIGFGTNAPHTDIPALGSSVVGALSLKEEVVGCENPNVVDKARSRSSSKQAIKAHMVHTVGLDIDSLRCDTGTVTNTNN